VDPIEGHMPSLKPLLGTFVVRDEGFTVDIFEGDDDQVEVWLDTEDGVKDGVIVGLGATRAEALDDAQSTLQKVLTTIDIAIARGA
jgi:hypothetical protein